MKTYMYVIGGKSALMWDGERSTPDGMIRT